MRILGIDLETYSSVDIKKSGLYKYAENSEILLFAYSWDGAPAEVVDFMAGEQLPADVLDALTDPDVLKTAYNAAFERNVIGHWLGYNIDPSQWFCTMVLGYTVGMPGGLDALGKVLHLSEDKQKMQEGKKLIQYFCKPCRPTKVNKGRTRNLPEHNPEGWKTFKEYCKRDVDSETAIRKKLWRFYPIESERRLWALDQIINDRGVLVDLDMARCAIDISARLKDQLLTEARELTGLDNPNSRQQALEWFESVEGYRPAAFDKAARAELLTTALDSRTRRFIEIKNLLGKTSVAKYEAMVNAYCVDNRVHGMLQFYGASRTGRWAGRLLQLHNLPQNHLDDLDDARNFVKANDLEALELVYGNVSDVLSQLIRTAFVAPPGHRFIVADFAAIEARVIAWLADEKWRMKVFADGGDIYCASASQMFKVPVEKHGINGHLRQKGKVAELACIAEGQLVLTDQGLVPIEFVTTDMRVWDGDNWVTHEGVIYKGVKEVMTYDGLTATPDHLVYVYGKKRPVQFRFASTSGSRLIQGIDDWRALGPRGDNQCGKTVEQKLEPLLCTDKVYNMRASTVAGTEQPDKRKIKRLSEVFPAKKGSSMVIQTVTGRKSPLRKEDKSAIPGIRGTGDNIQFSKRSRSRSLYTDSLSKSTQKSGAGPNRYEQGLRTWESPYGNAEIESGQPAENTVKRVQTSGLAVQLSGSTAYAQSREIKGRNIKCCKASCTQQAQELARDSKKARVYDIRNAGRNHRFTVSGKLVHNCGYGGGVSALCAFGADKMGMSQADMEDTISQWRKASPNIVKMWGDVEKCAKRAIRMKGTPVKYVKGMEFVYQNGLLLIRLPSGRQIAYVRPKIQVEDMGTWQKESLSYEGSDSQRGWTRLYTWGGKLVENCLAKDTLVLTNRGLVKIQQVRTDDLVYDGESFVSHDGLKYRGVQNTIGIDGLRMTPEHKILTERGMVRADSSNRFNWSAVSLPDSYTSCRKYKTEQGTMGMQMCMWNRKSVRGRRYQEKEACDKVMWLHEQMVDKKEPHNARDESASSLGCVALNEATLSGPKSQGLQKLRRQRYNSLSTLGKKLPKFLGGYGNDLATGPRPGQNRQQQWLCSRELQVGNQESELQQPKKQRKGAYARRRYDRFRHIKNNGHRRIYTMVPIEEQLSNRIVISEARRKEQVYDLLNCGPNHRFTVYDPTTKAFRIVSNCVQGIARDCLANCMLNLDAAGYRIVMHVHDECICEMPNDKGSLEEACEIMGRPIPWAPGLLLRADGYETTYYKKD